MRVWLIAQTVIVNNVPGYSPHRVWETDADELAEEAGRLCYESWERPNPETSANDTYLANILKQGHYSVMEHASATFYIDGVTRNFTHEHIRHRHFGYSEVSQRYCNVGQFEFIEHPGLVGIDTTARNKLLAAIDAGREAYDAIMDDLTQKGFGRKKARQAARHALPSGLETKILVTGNMRAWRDMLWKRLSPAADEEFRQVAKAILAELKNIAPHTFQDFELQDFEAPNRKGSNTMNEPTSQPTPAAPETTQAPEVPPTSAQPTEARDTSQDAQPVEVPFGTVENEVDLAAKNEKTAEELQAEADAANAQADAAADAETVRNFSNEPTGASGATGSFSVINHEEPNSAS